MKRNLSSLKRAGPTRAIRKRFIIFCEGRNTEPDYFKTLAKSLLDPQILVETVGHVGSPMTIARKALDEKRRINATRNKFEKSDEVWAVFDRDTHPHWDQAINLCEASGVHVGYSNPCFELWLILHQKDHDRPDNHKETQHLAAEILEGYDLSKRKIARCEMLLPFVDLAERRGGVLSQRRIDEGAPRGAPSSTVGRLTNAIRTWKISHVE